jgi:hypothetical protein
MTAHPCDVVKPLSQPEKVYFRNRLRSGRKAALDQSEAFLHICFAIEEIGQRLLGWVEALGKYEPQLNSYILAHGRCCATESGVWALSRIVRQARNEAMHTGAYARHVTAKAVVYCLLLEDALMNDGHSVDAVGDHMIKEPVYVEAWHAVSKARQLMLTHSFSNLPLQLGGTWYLLTEHGLAKYLSAGDRHKLLATPIGDAKDALRLVVAPTVSESTLLQDLLGEQEWGLPGTPLWLVLDELKQLSGVISVSELL